MEKDKTVSFENWSDIRELVLMSIGTDKGRWWADPSFGSELWILQQSGKIDARTARTVRFLILESLAWLKADGLAKDIECTAERTGKNDIAYTVTVFSPSSHTITIKEVWHGLTQG